jgi:glutamyl-tRNA synthetase
VVRLKMPREGTLSMPDLVRGTVEFEWAQEADHVVQRADGSFIYHLASVVDDRDFEHHATSSGRGAPVEHAPPGVHRRCPRLPAARIRHLPYVAEPGSKRKLSKRKLDAYLKNADFAKVHQHGLAIAAAMGLQTAPRPSTRGGRLLRAGGYLPEAIVNYLVLLGWSLDDKTEFMTRAQMIEAFSLDG